MMIFTHYHKSTDENIFTALKMNSANLPLHPHYHSFAFSLGGNRVLPSLFKCLLYMRSRLAHSLF